MRSLDILDIFWRRDCCYLSSDGSCHCSECAICCETNIFDSWVAFLFSLIYDALISVTRRLSYLLVHNEALKFDQHPRHYVMLLPLTGTDVELWAPSFPGSTESVTLLAFWILMFEGDRELTWLSSLSFAICPDITNRFLAFLQIARSSQDFRRVGDSAVGSPTTSVGDSSIGTSLFVMLREYVTKRESCIQPLSHWYKIVTVCLLFTIYLIIESNENSVPDVLTLSKTYVLT